MTARLEQLWAQLVDFFRAQPPARRIVLIATGVGSLTAVLALAWWVQRPLYRPLFTNLAEQDASAIVEALRAEKAPFWLEDGGRAILVPAERLYELRLALASRGLPAGGGVGFELFDRQTLGQTDYVQRLNYQRALQGELGRTISRLGGVESARVGRAPARRAGGEHARRRRRPRQGGGARSRDPGGGARRAHRGDLRPRAHGAAHTADDARADDRRSHRGWRAGGAVEADQRPR